MITNAQVDKIHRFLLGVSAVVAIQYNCCFQKLQNLRNKIDDHLLRKSNEIAKLSQDVFRFDVVCCVSNVSKSSNDTYIC